MSRINASISRYSGIALCLLLLLGGCTVRSKPIPYGETSCHFCSMTIVEKQHAAQLVTTKGKVFNFDALECMLNHISKIEEESIGLLLTNAYNQPEVLLDVENCTFLISKGIPSPMGAYLTAFSSEVAAHEAQKIHGGTLYNWQILKDHFAN